MANRYDGLSRRAHAHTLDLRGFRLSLVPPLTLPQAAAGAQVDKALLSRFETGRRAITSDCARHLARFYSAWTGREVTAGEILDLADRTRARCLNRSLRSRRRKARGRFLSEVR